MRSEQLAPTLQPDDIVIDDNLPSHQAAGVEQAIAARGAGILYLPPYSTDLNPIELAFAKLKQSLRTAAARTRETLWAKLGELVGTSLPRSAPAISRTPAIASQGETALVPTIAEA